MLLGIRPELFLFPAKKMIACKYRMSCTKFNGEKKINDFLSQDFYRLDDFRLSASHIRYRNF